MSIWMITGSIALAAVLCLGTIIKLITYSKVKKLDGLFDTGISAHKKGKSD